MDRDEKQRFFGKNCSNLGNNCDSFDLKNLKEKKRLYYDGRGGEWMIWMELGMANVSRWIQDSKSGKKMEIMENEGESDDLCVLYSVIILQDEYME